ncbi:MAG: hypothetical protein Q9160_000094 [Pyrenula sp. 1 TL-2023]
MTDLKPALNSIVTALHSAPPLPDERTLSSKQVDTFLDEAIQLNASIASLLTSLRRFRGPYLSTASPPRNKTAAQSSSTIYFTVSDRETLDTETPAQLRSFSALLESFKEAENTRSKTARLLLKKKYGGVGTTLKQIVRRGDESKSAQQAGEEGSADALEVVRKSILLYLGERLAEAGKFYREMFEIRVEREREKEKSVLWKTTGRPLPQGMNANMNGAVKDLSHDLPQPQPGTSQTRSYDPTIPNGYNNTPNAPPSKTHPHPQPPTFQPYNPALSLPSPDPSLDPSLALSPAQLTLLSHENSSLLTHYTSQLTSLTAAEKSLLEIADLQTQLSTHLDTQAEMIGNLVEDAANTQGDVERGNRELKKAEGRKSSAPGILWGTVALCVGCVVWDAIF